MSNSTRRFIVLSQSVNTSDDVFNSLVEVQDKETGEQGTLLCSHMCNWPSELINQAKWLEGCKTPEQFKDEPRLALGYHPEQYTQWRVFKELNEIEIYLTGCWNQGDDQQHYTPLGGDADGDNYVDEWYSINLPYNNTYFAPITRRVRQSRRQDRRQLCLETFRPSLIRLCKSVLSADITQESLNDFESLIHRLFNSGRINAWQACVLPSVLLSQEAIHWHGSNDIFMPGLSPYLDGGLFSEDHWVIPFTRSEEEGLTVHTNIPEAGFQRPVEFDLVYENGGHEPPTVLYCNPDVLLIVEGED